MLFLLFLTIGSLGAPCSPSPTSFCVRIQNGVYEIDSGDGFGFSHRELELNARTPFTFTMTGPGFPEHPFSITDAETQATKLWTDGVNGNIPCKKAGDQLTFAPPANGPSVLYYQSTADADMGARLVIPGACKPSLYHICLHHSEQNPGDYLIDQGEGPVLNGDLVLFADDLYELEAVGPWFLQYPFGISTVEADSVGIDSLYRTGIAGEYPAGRDNAVFTFIGARDGPSNLFYGSTLAAGLGGILKVDGACYPGPTHICITHGIPQGSPGFFFVDVGNGLGKVKQQEIFLNAGTNYTFQVIGVDFNQYPLAFTTSDSGMADTPLVEADGVSGALPCAMSGDEMYFVAPPEGPQTYYYQAQTTADMGGKITIAGACSPSETNICVTHNGGDPGIFIINDGRAEGAQAGGKLTLMAGTTYTFEVVGDLFADHPFALVNEDVVKATQATMLKASDGINGPTYAAGDDETIVWTPSVEGLRYYWYQSTAAEGLGGSIEVLGTCQPTEQHICVSVDTLHVPPQYLVNQGPGPVPNGDLFFEVGKTYTFEAVGNSFAMHPFALTRFNFDIANVSLVEDDGISGANPCVADGDVLEFTPPVEGPSVIYYASQRDKGYGGAIHIRGACEPTQTTLCVTHSPGTPGAFAINYMDKPGTETTGAIAKLVPTLKAGVTYRFEVVGDFVQFPLSLSATPDGDPLSFVSTAAQDGDIIEWTPPSEGPAKYYYGSTEKAGMGAQIRVSYTCLPSTLFICVTHDGGTPGTFLLNQGMGAHEAWEVKANTQASYTFHATGAAFALYPFALTTDRNQADAPMVEGVDGNTVLTEDGMELIFTPADLLNSQFIVPDGDTVYYQCLKYPDMGGRILMGPDYSTDPMTKAPTFAPTTATPTTPPPTKRPTPPTPLGQTDVPTGAPTTQAPTLEDGSIGGNGTGTAGGDTNQTKSIAKAKPTGMPAGIIVVIVIVVLAVVGGIIGAAVYFTKRTKAADEAWVPLNPGS